jgi:regulator of protease activity HflC (stomatin/prohibitin superfamily)
MKEEIKGLSLLIGMAMSVIGVILLLWMVAWPMLNVWRASLVGQAELKQAEWNRQIVVREAEAKHDAAKALADAEIERARGVAEANKIIGHSLRDNENYLRYLWIHNLETTKDQIIYVPTEAGLPILEAGRRPIPVK